MLGLGVSLLRSNRPIGELTVRLAYDLGDKTNNGGIIYYTNPPDLNATSTTSFEALPYSIKFPKDPQDNFYDYNSNEELVYTIPSTRILDATNNFSNIYQGIVKDNWVVLRRDNQTFTEISDDEKLIGWFNYVYSQNKDNFDEGFYFFPNEVNSDSQTKGAIFSTDTELFYDNVDISKLNVHVCVSAAVVNNFTNLFPTPSSSPVATPTDSTTLLISPEDLLSNGFDIPTIVKNVKYNQRYHAYTDYKVEINPFNVYASTDINKEYRATSSICLTETNKQINIQVSQSKLGDSIHPVWKKNHTITMTGEIGCLGPASLYVPGAASYVEFSVDATYNLTPAATSTLYGDWDTVITTFEIKKDILDPLFVTTLNKTVEQATYYPNSTGTHRFLYFEIKNIRFHANGYLPSQNLNSTDMTRSILVPTVSDSLANSGTYTQIAVAALNQNSLKEDRSLEPLALTVPPENIGVAYNTYSPKLRYSLYDITTFQAMKYNTSDGAITSDFKFVQIGSAEKQIVYRVSGKLFTWSNNLGAADTFNHLVVQLVRQNLLSEEITVLQSIELTPASMQLVVRVTNEFADTYYEFDYTNNYTSELSELVGEIVYVRIKITPITVAVQDPIYTTQDARFFEIGEESIMNVITFPQIPGSPIPAYKIPTIPTYND